ncbi:MAG: hypothetical protein J6N20_04765, partial [Pseudomonas sp.]|nr:hypothetical protein [Pseudomonas sp.]
MQNQIKLSQDRQSSLDRAKKEFFSHGGKVEVIGSEFRYVPIPSRKEPSLSKEEIKQRALAEQIRALAPEMNRAEIQKELGISYERVAAICRKFSITPKQAAGMHPNSRKVTRYDQEADRLMVERIKALAEIGLNKS